MFKFEFSKLENENGFAVLNTKNNKSASVSIDEKFLCRLRTEDKDYNHHCVSEYGSIQGIIADWIIDDEPEWWAKKHGEDKVCPTKVLKWYKKKARCALGKRFAEHWHEAVDAINNPKLRQLYKSFFCATGRHMPLDVLERIGHTKYLMSDMIKYPAAIYAYLRIRALSDDWMDYYSCYNKRPPALNRTIMNIPNRMPDCIVRAIAQQSISGFPIHRTLNGRCELIFYLDYFTAGDFENRIVEFSRHQNIFRNVSNKEIIRVARMARRRGLDYRMNSFRKIVEFKQYLNDYPEEYNGTFEGLFKRSYAWHQDVRNFTNSNTYADTMAFPKPKWIEKIDSKHINFISTVGDLKEESKQMRHCVGSYATKCVRGQSFIFHVSYKRQKATVELNPDGRVLQAKGPCNKSNEASVWAEQYFRDTIQPKPFDYGDLYMSRDAIEDIRGFEVEAVPF